jgi:uncharacterized protein
MEEHGFGREMLGECVQPDPLFRRVEVCDQDSGQRTTPDLSMAARRYRSPPLLRHNGSVLIVVSPAKSLDYESPLPLKTHTEPRMLDRAEQLITVMRTKSVKQVQALMDISPSLAELNVERYRDWERPFTTATARQALLAFDGDVYDGMAARTTFSKADFTHAQKTFRMLSGLYGVLRPLDLMMPYRLEMGTRLTTKRGKNLYGFWGDEITDVLRSDLAASPGDRVLVNLASQEYFGAVRPAKLDAPVVSPAFLDRKGTAEPKVISFFAKRARGVMAAWIIRERINSASALTEFTGAGYAYDPVRSKPDHPVFVRDAPNQ